MRNTFGYKSVNTWFLLALKDLSFGIIAPYFISTFKGL